MLMKVTSQSSSESEDGVTTDTSDVVASISKISAKHYSEEMEKHYQILHHLRCASHTVHLFATIDVTNGYKKFLSLADRHKHG